MARKNFFDADSDCLQEPLQFRLNGRDFTIATVTPKTLDDVIELGKTLKEEGIGEGKLEDILPMQLALLTGEDEEIFRKADYRQVSAVVKWIMDELNNADNVKQAIRNSKKG